MTDSTDNLDPEGVARGDYFKPDDKTVVAASPLAGDISPDNAGDTASPPPGNTEPASTAADLTANDATADSAVDAGASQSDDTADTKAVPYPRFKDVVDQKNAAQARVAALEAQLAAPVAPAAPAAPVEKTDKVAELVASRLPLYKQVEEARLDGEIELAATLQQKIDDLNAEILLEKSTAVSSQTVARDREQQQFNSFVETLEATYPQFRSNDPAFDAALVIDINETSAAYEAAGMAPLAALQRTLKLFAVRLNPPAAPATPAPVAPAAPAPAKPDVSKSVATIKSQPADMSTAGANKDEVTINVAALSDEEYAKLPESTKAKLRGDFTA